jgi:hypothetical protein
LSNYCPTPSPKLLLGINNNYFVHTKKMSSFRRSFIGGNWKCNGTVALTAEIVSRLNAAEIPASSEVCFISTTVLLMY